MKILVLGSDVPATSNMPGSPRLFCLCRNLSARHSLTLVTLSRSEERYQAFLADPMTAGVFEETLVLPSAPSPERLGGLVHRLRRQPYFITRFRTPAFHAELCRTIRDIYQRGDFDAIFADGLWVAQYVEDTQLDCPAIIDLHDSMTLLVIRMRDREPPGRRRKELDAEQRSIGRCEATLGRRFGAVITNSPVDDDFLKSLNPATNTLVIGNGVDSDFFGAGEAETDKLKIVFTGVMNYGPNEDAAIFFAESVLPLIQQRHPQAKFWIVGKDPGPNVQALAGRPGVHVTGGVPDIRPYVHTAGVFVSPLRYGTGVKNKLLAALAMEKPVVATRRTLDGLDVRENEDVLIADEPSDFAARVVQLIEDPALAKRLAKSGQSFVRERYSWEASARQLETALYSVTETGARAAMAGSSPRAS